MRRSIERTAPLLVWTISLGGMLWFSVSQQNAAEDLRYHWAGMPMLLMAGFMVVFNCQRSFSVLYGGAWLGLLTLGMLYVTWRDGFSDGSILLGWLPHSDAGGYYRDAQSILAGFPISDFSSRRPLFAAYLAGLLSLTGNDLPFALILASLFVIAALVVCAMALLRTSSHIAVAVFSVVIIYFYRRFVGTTLTEQLGLGLGLLALAFLVEGSRLGSRRLLVGGVLMLTLALNARAGAFFILPTLLAWLAYKAGAVGGSRSSIQTLLLLIAGIAVGFVANLVVLAVLEGDRAGAFSNFSYVLYGLVYGGDWTLALTQHPELMAVPELVREERIYGMAMRHIIDQPSALLGGAMKAWTEFIPRAYVFATATHPAFRSFAPTFVIALLAAAGLVYGIRSRKDPVAAMMLAGLLGIACSVPFVPPWDADRMRAYAATLPFMAWLPAIGVQGLLNASGRLVGHPPARSEGDSLTPLLFASGVLVIVLCFVLPWVARGRLPPAFDQSKVYLQKECPAGTEAKSMQLLPGTIRMVSAQSSAPSRNEESRYRLHNQSGEAPLSFGRFLSPLDKSFAEQHAIPRMVSDDARQFIRQLEDGDAVGFALLGGQGPRTLQLRYVIIRGGRGDVAQSGFFCVDKRSTHLDSLILFLD